MHNQLNHHLAMALQLKTFRITDQLSEDAVNKFLQGKRIHHWSTSFTDAGWNIVLVYEPERQQQRTNHRPTEHQHAPKKNEKPVEYIPDLSPEQVPLYETIRRWRNTRAREENIKPYVLFNNKQLEDIVKARPADTETLKSIVPDMNPEHFEKYSGEIVGMLVAS